MQVARVIPALLLIALSGASVATPPSTFREAKRVLPMIYRGHEQTIYCGCRYHYDGKKAVPDWESCGYRPRKDANRASRVEWEHVVPAWWIGHQRKCWQEGGRKNCRRTDPVFRRAEADLYNLYPAIGEINADRSNFRYQMIPGEARRYGQCDFEVDFKGRKAEPRPEIRGDLARTWFYMAERYDLRLSRSQKKLLQAWAKQDPVDAWERARARRIAHVMGWVNPFVVQSGHGVGRAGRSKVNDPVVCPQDARQCPDGTWVSRRGPDCRFAPCPERTENDAGAAPYDCSVRKTCSRMSSCEEAMYRMRVCGNRRLDRDRDGVPCEKLCR